LDVSASSITIIVLGVVAAVVVIADVAVRRKGYSIPGKTIVRWQQGPPLHDHLG
jgi:hypothetical protein